jgi:hypothetical protein
MSEKNVMILKNLETPKELGEYYRLLVLTGKDKGFAFFLTGARIVIGRSETADISIPDQKSSREHAELSKIENYYVISDLKSQNGIIVNDVKVAQERLKDGDRVIVGQTVFRYSVVVVTDQKQATIADNPTNGSKGQSQLQTQSTSRKTLKGSLTSIRKAKFEGKTEAGVGGSEEEAAKKKKKLALIGLILVVGAGIFFMDVGEEKKKVEVKKSSEPTLLETDAQRRQKIEDKELSKNLDVIFQRGLREAREGNYFRAISEFDLALVLSPQNGRARHYKDKTRQKLDEEIDIYFINGTRFKEALRYKSAQSEYCAVIRLLQNSQEDDRFKKATENIEELEKNMGMDKGEIKCL